MMCNFLGVIVGRENSKGLKNKNIKIFNGKPLIYWSIISAKKSKFNEFDSKFTSLLIPTVLF